MSSPVWKIVALPLSARQTLFASVKEGFADVDPASKLQSGGMLQTLRLQVLNRVRKQWESMKAANKGSYLNTMYRLAQFLISREDPHEVFMKNVPEMEEPFTVKVVHPDTVSALEIRKRLRLLAQDRTAYHRQWNRLCTVGILPFLPLLVTPLPNVPVYYLGYRIYSHRTATQGASAVIQMLSHPNQFCWENGVRHRMALDANKRSMTHGGQATSANSHLEAKKAKDGNNPEALDLEAQDAHIDHFVDFVPSEDLTARWALIHRKGSVDEEAVWQLERAYGLENVAQAMKRLRGSKA